MILYTIAKTDQELADILLLQERNLSCNLTRDEAQSQGFVTISHSLEQLKTLHAYEQQLLMKHGRRVVGYLLAMTKDSRNIIPVLVPMFNMFDEISYKGRLISDYNYIVVGQVCIEKEFRGKGLLDKSYEAYKLLFQDKFDFAITEIAVNNVRSIKAHTRVGFVELHRYKDENQVEWIVVLWEWEEYHHPGTC